MMHKSLKPNKIYQSKRWTIIAKTKKSTVFELHWWYFYFDKGFEEEMVNILMTVHTLYLPSLKSGLRIRIHFIRIRNQFQHFRLNTDPDPDPIRIRIQSGSRALMTKDWKKIQLKKKFGSKTTIYLSLGLKEERPSYRSSLQLSKEAIQHFKTWTL